MATRRRSDCSFIEIFSIVRSLLIGMENPPKRTAKMNFFEVLLDFFATQKRYLYENHTRILCHNIMTQYLHLFKPKPAVRMPFHLVFLIQ